MSTNAKTIGQSPRLRFPEFRNELGWANTSLASILDEHGEKSDGKSEVYSVSVHKGVVNQVEHLGRSYAASDKSNYNLVRPHDVIYTKSPTGDFPYGVVKQSRLPFNVIVSPLYGVFSPGSDSLGYLVDAYFESAARTSNYLAPLVQKGAKNTLQISNARFLAGRIPLPRLQAEQRKVADCLKSVDAFIAIQRRKVEALEAHKRGLLQQLFPANNETVPRLRFPGFRRAPAWQHIRLGDTAEFYKGKGISKSDLDATGSQPCIRYGELYTHYNEVIDTVVSRTKVRASDLFLSQKNDVIIPASGESKLDIAKAACVLRAGVALGGDLNVIRSGHDGVFLSYYLNSAKRLDIAKVAQGDSVVHLYPSQLEQLTVTLPDRPEQVRIAKCLSTVDEAIALQVYGLNALRIHKQGLLQQLFPSDVGAEP